MWETYLNWAESHPWLNAIPCTIAIYLLLFLLYDHIKGPPYVETFKGFLLILLLPAFVVFIIPYGFYHFWLMPIVRLVLKRLSP